MIDIDEKWVPELAPGVDLKSLKVQPTPEEFFVLSRIDGSITIDSICKTSGLGKDKTLACFKNLHQYGLVQLPISQAEVEPARSQDDNPGDNRKGPVSILERFPIPLSDFDFDPQLLDQSVELDDDFKREVAFVHAQLDTVDHYQLLGVDSDARRRQLRSSYFEMSKRYHPDRFYQKILGDYQPMVERIFQRVTKAYQTLSNRKKRKDYDAQLARGRQSHATPAQASTPASRRSEPREAMKDTRKRDMAFKVLVQRGDKAFESGHVSAALKEYRKALTLKRDEQTALRIARALLDEPDHLEDATAFARAAQKIAPQSLEALTLLGEVYERREQFDDAVYHYEQALEFAPSDSDLKSRVDRLRS
jgi:curved DNA-binding protein CbpA